VRKRICKITFLLSFTILLSGSVIAQYIYTDKMAVFTVFDDSNTYRVNCRLSESVDHSRKLQRMTNQLRLQAIDLIGNCIVLQSIDLPFEDRGALFQAFVDNTSLRYSADVDKIEASALSLCGKQRCIEFSCNKSDFRVNERYLGQDFDMANILYMNFRRTKDIAGACALLQYTSSGPDQLIPTELQFLNGSAAIDPEISVLLKTNPSYRLENSLYGNDSILQEYVNTIASSGNDLCPFGKMIISKILFTSSKASSKQGFYNDYIYKLSQLNGLWYGMMQFVATHRDSSGFAGFEEATVFDVIGAFPVALNPFGMRMGDKSDYFNLATRAFAGEDFETALENLQNEINFNGITTENLNLTGACYRLLDQPARALAYLLLAYYLDSDTKFVKGNIVLCLHKLNYTGIDELSSFFLKETSTDPWSENQIMNLKKY